MLKIRPANQSIRFNKFGTIKTLRNDADPRVNDTVTLKAGPHIIGVLITKVCDNKYSGVVEEIESEITDNPEYEVGKSIEFDFRHIFGCTLR